MSKVVLQVVCTPNVTENSPKAACFGTPGTSFPEVESRTAIFHSFIEVRCLNQDKSGHVMLKNSKLHAH